jgi:hypothetical protein
MPNNNRLKELVLQIRYPYTAATISIIWIGTAFLIAINESLPVTQMVILDSIASIVIALIGFPHQKR